jgi:hypothetical protein
MAATYDISITDLKVVIKTTSTGNTEIKTFARDKHKAKLSESSIFISDINSSDDVFVFGDITVISTITNYREGASDSITVPVSIELLYTDVIEDIEAPFFFEALQVDAAGAVGVVVTEDYDEREIVYLSPAALGNIDYISYLSSALEIKRETLSYDGFGNITGVIIT